MQIISIDNQNILEVLVDVIKKGGLVVLPTDTCYGLVCDASNEDAVRKLYEYKGREASKPTGIYVGSIEMASLYVELTIDAKRLYNEYFPGALTVISRSKYKLARSIEIKGTLGVRIPDLPLLLSIITSISKPLAQTSANQSGSPTPYSISELRRYTPNEKLNVIDIIVDGGVILKKLPSTIVDVSTTTTRIVRHGDLEISI